MNNYDSNIHHRRSIRLPDYDYKQSGVYYVTLCVAGRQCLLGEISDDAMVLNTLGCVVDECWLWLQNQYPYIELDAYVVMPNHLHGVIIIMDDAGCRGGSRTAPTQGPEVKPLGRLIGAFKTTSTKRINKIRGTSAERFWQRNYYEHIVRNEADWNRIHQYIATNPQSWSQDSENPNSRNHDH